MPRRVTVRSKRLCGFRRAKSPTSSPRKESRSHATATGATDRLYQRATPAHSRASQGDRQPGKPDVTRNPPPSLRSCSFALAALVKVPTLPRDKTTIEELICPYRFTFNPCHHIGFRQTDMGHDAGYTLRLICFRMLLSLLHVWCLYSLPGIAF